MDRAGLTGGADRLVMGAVRLRAARFHVRVHPPVARFGQRGKCHDELRRHHQNGEDGIQPAGAAVGEMVLDILHNPTDEPVETLDKSSSRVFGRSSHS